MSHFEKVLLKKLIVVLLFCLSSQIMAQVHEFGLGLGGFNYAGDLMRGYHVTNVKPGMVAYYRRNLDNIFCLRGSLTGGLISGTDKKPIDPFGTKRNASFQSTIVEAAAIMEYNFLDYKKQERGFRWSPYMFVGVSGFTFFGGNQNLNGASTVQLALPFGGGFKYVINPSLNLNLEIGIRKLFFDRLDGYSDGDITNKNYQYGNKYDNDWINFVGISISYLIWDVPCPYDFY